MPYVATKRSDKKDFFRQMQTYINRRKKENSSRSHDGFTIVELLIVIIVIAILAATVIVAYNGVTSRANDAQRVSDIETVHKFLESYFITNGHYMTSDNFLNANAATALSSGPLTGLSKEALRGPGASSSVVSSFVQSSGSLSATNDYAMMSYVDSGATACTLGGGYADSQCGRYELFYRKTDGTTVKVDSNEGQ